MKFLESEKVYDIDGNWVGAKHIFLATHKEAMEYAKMHGLKYEPRKHGVLTNIEDSQ